MTRELIDAAPHLRVIARAGTGVDNVDVDAATARGILVMNAPGANSISVAELAIGFVLALARHIPAADAAMKRGLWEKKKFLGEEVRDKTLGLAGFGRIGQEVARRALALGMRSIAFLARVTRSAMLDALAADYTRTARAKGLSERVVTLRHALRNAMIPIITVLGLDFGAYLTGSILTETVFSWPGIGRYVVGAIARRDLPAIQGTVLFLSAVFVLVNLLADIAYAKTDPRVAYS